MKWSGCEADHLPATSATENAGVVTLLSHKPSCCGTKLSGHRDNYTGLNTSISTAIQTNYLTIKQGSKIWLIFTTT
jgi:hypothetical protein